MTDQTPSSSPYEPPSGSTGGDTGPTEGGGAAGGAGGYEPPNTGRGYEPPGTGAGGYEPPPSTGGGYEPAGGPVSQPPPSGGSVYESSSYQPPGGPSGYPQPAGGQPPPPYQPTTTPVAPGARNNTVLFGVLGIVLAVLCCPLLGILFGWLSMNEARKTGGDETLGKVGFWLGIAITTVAVIGSIVAICAGGFGSWNYNNRY